MLLLKAFLVRLHNDAILLDRKSIHCLVTWSAVIRIPSTKLTLSTVLSIFFQSLRLWINS